MEDSSIWGWFKKTGESIINIYKEDLQEFGNSIKKDTEEAVKNNPNSILNNLFIKEESNEKKEIEINNQKKEISELQQNPSTYCIEPSEEENYLEWKKTFLLSTKTEYITNLLNSSAILMENYKKFVPNVVNYDDFWHRYLFRLHKLEEKELKRAELIERASKALHDTQNEMKWDDIEVESENKNTSSNEIQITKEIQITSLTKDNENEQENKLSIIVEDGVIENSVTPNESIDIQEESKDEEKTSTIEENKDGNEEDWGEWN
eukprot:TRINITY_DN16748_c0_g1_i1.p1 TRINITY_DN16748_c0_g1~~TRINITY_DN16748_c0_g1_i1.p1  ORF type:complete len:263 (-),score=85.69 TRINITY_DN16748_c0_g1_i1:32-820(-)